jgi:hypothetical protein
LRMLGCRSKSEKVKGVGFLDKENKRKRRGRVSVVHHMTRVTGISRFRAVAVVLRNEPEESGGCVP